MESGYASLHRPGVATPSPRSQTTTTTTTHHHHHQPDPPSDGQSEPLSRDGSSDGSTRASPSVASPPAGWHASPETRYRQLLSATTAACLGADGRARCPAERRSKQQQQQQQQQRDSPVCCLHPGCTARPFKRRADLDRHYKHRHAPDSVKDAFSCDYPRCSRRQDPFHRLDHFRDHLRDFHKEDIEKRGGGVADDDDDDGRPASSPSSPPASSSWWRCRRCLRRVYGGQRACPQCRTPCQPRRRREAAGHVTRPPLG